MTLRDYFAAKCPLTLEETAKVYGMTLDEILRRTDHSRTFMAMDASMRTDWADAMLEARKDTP